MLWLNDQDASVETAPLLWMIETGPQARRIAGQPRHTARPIAPVGIEWLRLVITCGQPQEFERARSWIDNPVFWHVAGGVAASLHSDIVRLCARQRYLDHQIGWSVEIVRLEVMQPLAPEALQIGQKCILAQPHHEA